VAYIQRAGKVEQAATTDLNGRFSFNDVDPGLWQLGIQVPAGMELTNYAQNPFQVWMDQNGHLDLPFGLIPLPTATPTPRPRTVYLPLMLSDFTPQGSP
jgi:hypothetical protein